MATCALIFISLLGLSHAGFPTFTSPTSNNDQAREILQKMIPQSVIDEVGQMVQGMTNGSAVASAVTNEVVGPTVKFYLYTSPRYFQVSIALNYMKL